MKELEILTESSFGLIPEKYVPNTQDNIGNFAEICNEIKRIDYLPFENVKIQFSSDTWEFAPMITDEYQLTRYHKFIFKSAHSQYKEILKFYIYDRITVGKVKIQTLVDYNKRLRRFSRHLGDNYIYSLEFVTLDTIKNFTNHLQEENCKMSTIQGYVNAILSLFRFYEERFPERKLLVSSREIENHYSAVWKQHGIEKKTPVKDRTPDVPNSFFNPYLSTAIKIMDSKDVDINERGIASLIVLFSQTGLRASQVITLKTNAIRKVSIMNNEKTAYFMTYTSIKKVGGNNTYVKGETILNDLGYRAYTTLVNIYKEHREKIGTDFLFCPTTTSNAPIGDTTLHNYIKKFCFQNAMEIGCVNVSDKYPELKTIKVSYCKEKCFAKDRSFYNNFKDDDEISYISTHQFRVHLCTELYYKNIPLAIIQHYMNHLSEDMADYYVRRSEFSAKEEEYANSVLKVIVEEGSKPLGANSDALISKINEFIEKGKFNVRKDIDTIISELKRRMPIKEKLGGICIKSGPKRDCSKDAATDEFYCAYGVCPNHFHLYTMADITYTRCKAIVKTMEHNEKQGFIRQSQKEKNKLIHVTKHSLIPELNQLNEELSKKGSQWIKEKHPNLEDIINNLETITEEVNSWIA